MKFSTCLLLVPFFTVPFAFSTPARAQDPAAAQELFTEAKRLIQLGNWGEACPKLEESQRLDPGMGTQFNLAECNEHLGKTATAWALFIEVAAESKNAGQSAREKSARAHAAALEPKLSRVTLLVRSHDTGLAVTRDGLEVGSAQWGSAVPVDPGDHTVKATAPGKKTWEKTLHVAAAAGAIAVEIPALDDAPAPVAVVIPAPFVATPPPSVDTAPPAAPVVDQSVVLADHPDTTSGRRTLGAVIAGAGAIGIGVGAAFGILSLTKHDNASSHCLGNVCDAYGASQRDDARTAGNVSTVAVGVGAAVFVGGAILFLTAPRQVTSARIQAAPMMGTSGNGFTLRGAF